MAKTKSPAARLVGLSADLRKAHAWVEPLAEPSKSNALQKRRVEERTKGSVLEAAKVAELVDELDALIKRVGPLEKRRKEIIAALLAHWGHTGVEELEGMSGKALVSASFQLCLDPAAVKGKIGETLWERVVLPVLQAEFLVAEGDRFLEARDALAEALRVRKLTMSVLSPASRGLADSEAPAPEEEGEE